MANSTERIGVYHIGKIAEKNGWMFREQVSNDIGIDAHIEFIDSSNRPKQLLALQIKSGASWFKETNDKRVIFRDINKRQYDYWTMNSLPCLIVLYNPDNDLCIWQELSTNTIKKTNGGKGAGYFVEIPFEQIFLDGVSNQKLLDITNLPIHIINYNFLLSQKPFMEIIKNGGVVKLHSTEWVNKSSGRGTTELIVETENGVNNYLYPFWFPYTPYTDVFPRLFPWANFAADEDYYEDMDMENWHNMACAYDSETGEWIEVGETFSDFRRELNPMRYIDHAGEIAEYMLVLSLNDLGESFLKIEEFVSQNQPYVKARPKKEE